MINVSCALIINDKGEILATQRSATMKLPLKWEFPGGKVEESETPEECLIREIKEEIGVDIVIIKALATTEHQYKAFNVRLFPFLCEITCGEIELAEHASYLWLAQNELLDLDWAEADIAIIYAFLKSSYL